MNNLKAAMPLFEKSLALDPNNSRLMYEIGLIAYGNHDDKNLIEVFADGSRKRL
jgi:hypothetical protein